MSGVKKPSISEATATVKEIVRTSTSDGQIRARLNAAGFNGDGASIASCESDGLYVALVQLSGPDGEFIDV